MSQMPDHFSLLKENDKHFVVHDARDNTHFSVAKAGIHPATQIKIMKMKKFANGGDVTDSPDESLSDASVDASEQAPPGIAAPQNLAMNDPSLVALNPLSPVIPGLENNEAPSNPDLGQGAAAVPIESAPLNHGASGDFSQSDVAPSGAVLRQPAQNNSINVSDLNPQAASPQALSALENQSANAINNEAKAQSAQQEQLGKAQEQFNQIMQTRQDVYDKSLQNYQKQYDDLFNQVSTSKVDPNRYWNSKSTGSKISAGIGILLGGIGQGLLHTGSNAVMDQINHQINNDINAQKEELGKKESLLSRNLQVQGNLTSAENATRLQYSAMLQGKLQEIANKTNSPIILAKAQAQIANLKRQDLPMMSTLAAGQAQRHLIQTLNNPSTNLENIDPAQLVEHLPGRPETKTQALKDIQAAQITVKDAPEILHAYDMAQKTFGLKNTLPYVKNPYIDQMQALLGPTLQNLEGSAREGQFNKLMESVTPQYTDFSKNAIQTRRKALADYLASKMNSASAKSLGIDLNKFKSTKFDSSPAPVERIDPNSGKTALFNPETKQFVGWKN